MCLSCKFWLHSDFYVYLCCSPDPPLSFEGTSFEQGMGGGWCGRGSTVLTSSHVITRP